MLLVSMDLLYVIGPRKCESRWTASRSLKCELLDMFDDNMHRYKRHLGIDPFNNMVYLIWGMDK